MQKDPRILSSAYESTLGPFLGDARNSFCLEKLRFKQAQSSVKTNSSRLIFSLVASAQFHTRGLKPLRHIAP